MVKDYSFDTAHTFEGLWWLPANADDQVAGTLAYEPGKGLRLRLIGALGELEDVIARINATVGSKTLHGLSVDGRPITLLKAVHAAGNLSFPGLMTEEYIAVSALIGGHFDDDEVAAFTRSQASFRGLPEWLARDPFTRTFENSPRRVTIVAEPQARWDLGRIAGGAVFADMTVNWNDDRLTRTELTALDSIGVEPDGSHGLRWHIDQLSRLNRLVALCTGRQLPWRSIWLRAGEKEVSPGVTVPVRVDLLTQIVGETPWKAENDPPIYSAKELLAANPDAMARWFAVADDLKPVIDLFFTVLGDRGLPLEAAFLLTIQAIEVHHRRTGTSVIVPDATYDRLRKVLVAAIPEETPAPMREKLEGALSFANEPSLSQRLKALIERMSEAFGDTPFGFDQKRIRAAVNTRNYYTHYSPKLTKKASEGADLYHLTAAFRPLLFALLLAELELPLADIRAHLQRRQAFSGV